MPTLTFGSHAWADEVPSVDDSGVYIIKTADDLAWFAGEVNGGNTGISAVLANDIECSYSTSEPWPVIGNENGCAFTGTFDGQGHTISSISTTNQRMGIGYKGLIGYANGATVKNVTVSDSSFRGFYTGAIIGTARSCTIVNCGVTATVYVETPFGVKNNTGTFVGMASGGTVIENCWTAASRGESTYAFVGGADGSVTIKNCVLVAANADSVDTGYLNQMIFNFPKDPSGNDLTSDSFELPLTAGVPSMENVYYLESIATAQGEVAGLNKTAFDDFLADGKVLSALNQWVDSQKGDYARWAVASGSTCPTLYEVVVPEHSYAVEYVLGGGVNSEENLDAVTRLDSFTLADPTREGCTFEGWYSDAAYTERVSEVSEGTSGSLTLYAKWSNPALNPDAEGVYQLDSLDDVQAFCDEVNAGNTGIKGHLTRDLDLEENPLPVLGDVSSADAYKLGFAGVFDGGNHTITFSSFAAPSKAAGAGFVAYLGGGTIENLTLESPVVIATTKLTTGVFVYTANGGVISNCTSRVSLEKGSTGYYAAGIVAIAGGAAAPAQSGYATVLENCVNEGDLSGFGIFAAGVLYYANSSEGILMYRCANEGDVSSSNSAGGLVASNYETLKVIECSNSGAVSAPTGAAGLVGSSYGSVEVTDSYNTGAIAATGATGKAGGLVASVYEGSFAVQNAYVRNTVSGSEGNTGAIVGSVGGTAMLETTFDNVYWTSESCDVAWGNYLFSQDGLFTEVGSEEDGEGFATLAARLGETWLDDPTSGSPILMWQGEQITYVLGGGENNEANPSAYAIGTSVTLAEPTYEHHVFEGWYDNEAFEGDAITEIPDTSTGAVTLYAKWKSLIHTITYVLDGGTNASDNPDTYIEGTAVSLVDPTRAGYTFEGWYDNAELAGDAVTEISASANEDVTLYAAWSEVDKTKLESAVADAKAIKQGNKTDEDFAALQAAIEDAEKALADAEATQAQVDAAVKLLNAAVDTFGASSDVSEPVVVDTSALSAAIADAKAIEQGSKTDKAFAALQTAIAGAEEILADKGATQTEVDGAVALLSAAVDTFKASADKSPYPPFVDVDYDGATVLGWAAEWIDQAAELGLMTGYRDPATQELTGEFGPADNLCRKDAILVLYRVLTGASDSEDWGANSTPLTDVSASDYYTNALNWAYETGVVTGDVDSATKEKLNTFRPDEKITRQELALLIWRAAGSPEAADGGKALAACVDSADAWAESADALAWTASVDVMSGNVLPDGTKKLDAYADANRAQAAKMFVQALPYIIE